MTGDMINELINRILVRLPMQKFSIEKTVGAWSENDRERFDRELHYLLDTYSLDEIVEGYVILTQRYFEECSYFRKNGTYRYSSFEEVDRMLYKNDEYMKSYMLGLEIAEFLWRSLLRVHAFFESVLEKYSGEDYLEIGVGHGKYFLEAVNKGRYSHYDGIDVSEQAVVMAQQYVREHIKPDLKVDYRLMCRDAVSFSPEHGYDMIVIQEVLEHIEDPAGMLLSIRKMLKKDGGVYALFPINAPSPAHIFLFSSVEHVKQMIDSCGFAIEKEEYITANDISLEDAQKRKKTIDACIIMKAV